MLFVCAWLVSQRVRNYERGAPDDRRTTKGNLHRRMRDFRAGVWMQTLLRDPAAGLMHSCIYFGFLWLFIATVVLELDHQLPDNLKFLHGGVYEGYAFAADLAGVVFTVGIVWAIARRYLERPYRIRIKTKPEDAVILLTFLVIALTGFFTEALRIARGRSSRLREVVVRRVPALVALRRWSASGLNTAHEWLWGIHFAAFVAFLIILPTTKLRHMITSPMNMYLKDQDRPKGAMKPMPNLMETDLETFGAATIEDFTWKQLFDTDACTICGRCTSVCPAHATGKPLDPREIVLKVGEVMAATGDPVVSPPVSIARGITITADSVFERVTSEELWACTSCKACDEICPVNIEILDKILDMRRYLSLMESDFPAELGNTYRSMENSSNVYGMNQGDRGDWADGPRRRRDRRGRLGRRSATSTSTGSGARARSTTATRRRAARSPSCCSAPASTSPSSARASSAPATRPDARATSTSSRCWRCRTSSRSTGSACRRSSRSARTASTR